MKKSFLSKFKFFKLNVFTIFFFSTGLFVFSTLFLYGCSNNSNTKVNAITSRLYTPQTARIYDLSFPLQFEVSITNGNIVKTMTVSGTSWVFDKLLPVNNNNNISTYYIATNHHCVDFVKDLKEIVGNSFSNTNKLMFTVNLNLPNYQFSPNSNPNDKMLAKFENNSSINYSYNIEQDFGTYENKKISSNTLYYLINSNFDENSLIKYDPYNLESNVFNFDIVSWTDVLKQTNNYNTNIPTYNIDLALIKIDIQNKFKMNCMKSFDEIYVNNNTIPFLINETKKADNFKNKKIFVGGFPKNFETKPNGQEKNEVRWVCTETTIETVKTLYGYINDKSTIRNVGLSYGLDLYHGSSGSIVMDENFKIIGIYWGTITSNNVNKVYGCFDIFLLNNVFDIYKQYVDTILKDQNGNQTYNSFLVSNMYGTTKKI